MKTSKTLPFFSLSLILLISSTLSAELCHPSDKKTLLQIKKSFTNSELLGQWTPDTDCCEWYYAKCDQTTNRITSIFIINDDRDEFSGTIPESVGDLPYLTALSFRNLPKLTGTLPKSITKLKYLDSIWITKTNLTGTIPSFLGDIPLLNYINFQSNNLYGPIPSSLSKLRKLNYLALDDNHLTGPIPESFGAFAKNPDLWLKLSRNQLSGSIPKSLRAVDLTELDLSRNKFTGDASMLFGKSKKLQRVHLSRNNFSFDTSKLEFSKSLNILDLSHNAIYGSLPMSLTKLPHLQQFDVSYNKLCGKIPTSGALKGFDASSYVHNKCLCGSPLPACK